MHCPDSIKGEEYVSLIAAVSILLSENLNDIQTYILGEFLQSVSFQLFTLAAFKTRDGKKKK